MSIKTILNRIKISLLISCVAASGTVIFQDYKGTNISAASYNSLSAADQAAFNTTGANIGQVTNVTSTKSTSIEGKDNINGYQWTAWFNENSKNFTIDKTQTNGTYTVGVPAKTGSNQINANMTQAGYYKYLSDPVYSEIRLKAYERFNWTEEWDTSSTSKKTFPWKYFRDEGSLEDKSDDKHDFSKTIRAINEAMGNTLTSSQKKQLNKKLWAMAENGQTVTSDFFHNNGMNGSSIGGSDNTITDGNQSIQYSLKVEVYGRRQYRWKVTTTTTTTYHHVANKSATVEIANTVVAQNVSATELSKYATFTLKSKNGGTGAVNTQVVKSNGGWWGSNHPAYHQGNNTTIDANGTYYYWSNSGSGSNGVNLRNIIPIKEKLYTFAGVPTNLGKDNKYTLTINPNGGEYNGNPGITSIKQLIGTSYTVNTPSRDGYILSGWDFSGSGTWNPNNQKYTFGTGDGSLTAKWIAKTPETDPNNPDNTNKKYTLTIDPNGGKYNNKTTPTTITKKIGDSESIKNPKRSDYIFLGWKVVSGDSNCFSQGTSSSMYRFYSDATLQAQWIKKGQSNSGTVIIDPNGGNYDGSTNKVTISGNAGSTTTIKTPVKDGYIFKGWEVINIEKNKFNGNTFTFIQGTTTLKAKWEVIKIDPCIVNGTGVDACGTNQDSMPGTWVHLSKDIY
ncbi:MAG: InlB B-repeat-containing protein [Thomasclavelia ramosa]|nr:InlB B-repeat-containing protein [Thomasclavelia ramosa]